MVFFFPIILNWLFSGFERFLKLKYNFSTLINTMQLIRTPKRNTVNCNLMFLQPKWVSAPSLTRAMSPSYWQMRWWGAEGQLLNAWWNNNQERTSGYRGPVQVQPPDISPSLTISQTADEWDVRTQWPFWLLENLSQVSSSFWTAAMCQQTWFLWMLHPY